jgi:uncharacterized LabA/DUF88 family protein
LAGGVTAPPCESGDVCPRQARLEIFVDGTNFEIEARSFTQGRSLDIPHLARRLAKQLDPQSPGHLLVKMRYCTSPAPWMRGAEFEKGFFDALRQSKSVDLLLGRHERRGADSRGRPRYEEKETDTNVAIQIVAGAYEDRYDVALVISGDTDMVPAMKMARARGKRVVWGHFACQAGVGDLRKVSDAAFLFDNRFLRTCRHFVVKRR